MFETRPRVLSGTHSRHRGRFRGTAVLMRPLMRAGANEMSTQPLPARLGLKQSPARLVHLGPWSRFLLRRLGGLVGVVSALMVATFVLIHLTPGDPARRIAGIQATPEDVARIRQSLGLNDPLWVQFLHYVNNVRQFNLGNSFVNGEPVAQILQERLPATAELAALAFAVIMLFSLPIGLLAAAYTRESRHPRLELLFTAFTGVGGSIPSYLAGTLVALVFAVWLRLLPIAGGEDWNSVVLPTLAVSIGPTAIVARIVRVETLNVLSQDYIRLARSKRLPILVLYARHVLPNVLTGALTVGGIVFASLLGGTVVVENVFAWPGLGTKLISSVLLQDYPVVQGIALFLGFGVVVTNAAVDVILTAIDRRSTIGAA
jgi:peptide/nickel transport system permease protein